MHALYVIYQHWISEYLIAYIRWRNFFFSCSGTCKHTMALLFALAEFVSQFRDRSLAVGTDRPCSWTVSRKESLPVPVEQLDYRYKKQTPLPSGRTPDSYNPLANLNPTAMHRRLMNTLRECAPRAVVHTMYPAPGTQEVIDSVPVPDTSLPSIPVLAAQYVKSSSGQAETEDFTTYCKKSLTPEQRQQCKLLTQGTEAWRQQRLGRVTASIIHGVYRFTGANPDGSLVKQVLNGTTFKSEATEYGNDSEASARDLYSKYHASQHDEAHVSTTGLHIDDGNPFLAASPDGLVDCRVCGKGLLEIKSTFKFRDMYPSDVARQPKYHVGLDENQAVYLKPSSPWHSQIQCQMGVCKRKWCDFVLYINHGIVTCRILFNEDLWQRLMAKADSFHRTYIVPKLLSVL